MRKLGDFPSAVRKVQDDVDSLLVLIRQLAGSKPLSAAEGVALLSQIRDAVYEDLNQTQHEYLILAAVTWLISEHEIPNETEWYWNPRQTGDAEEPDLRASIGTRIVLSAEITTSKRPIGAIVGRMNSTLRKLDGFPGDQYYFVRTDAMAKKAREIVAANMWHITVVRIPHVNAELHGHGTR
jgi:hypothetical protein